MVSRQRHDPENVALHAERLDIIHKVMVHGSVVDKF